MNYKNYRKSFLMVTLSLLLVILMPFTASASSDVNTDSDTVPVDGYYTFTGNGDWYGYESYLNYDFDGNSISGREYEVTLPQDGRLNIKLTTEDPAVFIDVEVLEKGDRVLKMDKDWQFGSISDPISVDKNSDMLKAGTYSVLFRYNNTRSELIQYDDVWPPGYHEFYHKLTFVTLSAEEQTAFNVQKKIKALPYVSDLTLSDESSVNSVNAEYNALSSSQKTLISTYYSNKLTGCLEQIQYLKEAKASEEASSDGSQNGTDGSSSGDTDNTNDSSGANDDSGATDYYNNDSSSAADPAKTEVTNSNGTFRILSESAGTAALVKARNKSSVTVPATVKIGGRSYKVTTVNANAFKGSRIRTVTIGKNVKKLCKNAFRNSKVTKVILKTKLLKKAKVKGSLKGSKVKTVSVKITKKASKTNRTYVKKYKKYFTRVNAGKKVSVK